MSTLSQFVGSGGAAIGEYLRLPAYSDILEAAPGREYLRVGALVAYATKYAGSVLAAPWIGHKGSVGTVEAVSNVSVGNAERVQIASNGTSAIWRASHRSADLSSWATQATGMNGNGQGCIAFPNGTYVGSETAGIRTSPDGVTWTQRLTGMAGSPVVFAYLSTGTIGLAASSLGGTANELATRAAADPAGAWTLGSATGANMGVIGNIVASSSAFCAVGQSASNVAVATSTNGTTWTARTTPFGSTAGLFRDVAWTGNRFIAHLSAGSGVFASRLVQSTDGTGATWNTLTEPEFVKTWSEITSIASDGNGRVILTGYYNPIPGFRVPMAAVSLDHGATWAALKTYWYGSDESSNGAMARCTFAGGRFWLPRVPPSGSIAGLQAISITPAQLDSATPQWVGARGPWGVPQGVTNYQNTQDYVRIL